MSFVGGRLKLKGDQPLKGGIKKKTKKKEAQEGTEKAIVGTADGTPAAADDDSSAARKALLKGYSIESVPADEDRRTEAERKHAMMVRQREEERLRKLAGQSHRDRVKEFNEYLTNLSEHHDIPKVGPG